MTYRWLVSLLAVACVAGCDSAPENSTESAPAARASAPAPALPPHMVSAVAGGKGNSSVDLKFALVSRPEPGRPLAIDLAVIPREADVTVRVIVQNTDGIAITAGQEVTIPKGAEPGEPVIHRLTVLPARDGIFSLSAVALVDSDKTSVTRTFAIPIIVGEGITPAELTSGGEPSGDSDAS
ncbi:MAG TPA: hypothetical protein PKL49_11515 [Steroidobacteraceae bacterium]|jgi:hypothetical protein|nr:hypothetical protein [Steroidobacteraceae bacterium]